MKTNRRTTQCTLENTAHFQSLPKTYVSHIVQNCIHSKMSEKELTLICRWKERKGKSENIPKYIKSTTIVYMYLTIPIYIGHSRKKEYRIWLQKNKAEIFRGFVTIGCNISLAIFCCCCCSFSFSFECCCWCFCCLCSVYSFTLWINFCRIALRFKLSKYTGIQQMNMKAEESEKACTKIDLFI